MQSLTLQAFYYALQHPRPPWACKGVAREMYSVSYVADVLWLAVNRDSSKMR